MPRPLRKLALLAVVGMLAACGSFVGKPAAQEYERFFALPLAQQHERFAELPLSRQLDIYLHAVLKRHPPDLSFAYDIASGGETVLPFLAERLRDEENEGAQQSIIYVFEVLTREGYDLRSDSRLIELVRQKVSLMKQPFNKERSRRSLEVILREQ